MKGEEVLKRINIMQLCLGERWGSLAHVWSGGGGNLEGLHIDGFISRIDKSLCIHHPRNQPGRRRVGRRGEQEKQRRGGFGVAGL